VAVRFGSLSFSDGCHWVCNDEVLTGLQVLMCMFLVICAMIVRCVMMNSLLQAKHTIFLSGLYWQWMTAEMRLFDADVTSN